MAVSGHEHSSKLKIPIHRHWKQTNFLLKGFPGHSSSEDKEKDNRQMHRTCYLRGRCEIHTLSQVISLFQIPGSSV